MASTGLRFLIGCLGVHFLPKVRRRFVVNSFQRLDGAQDGGISLGLEITPEILEGHPIERRQIGHLRVRTAQKRQRHALQRRQIRNIRVITL